MPVVHSEMTFGDEAVPLPIEVDEDRSAEGLERSDEEGAMQPSRAAKKVAGVARDLFAVGMKTALACGRTAVACYLDIPEAERPDAVELQLGLNLDANIGAVLVKVGGAAHIQVTLRCDMGS